MAVTLTSTGITFSNGTSQNTAATSGTVLGNIQYGGYDGSFRGSTGDPTGATSGLFLVSGFGTTNYTGGRATYQTVANELSANTVWCGMQYYKTGNINIGSDAVQDTGLINQRPIYRNIS